MKTIATLTGVEFLKQCNKIRHRAAELLHTTAVLDIRKNLPAFTGEETTEERKTMLDKQGKENINAMLDRLLDEYPEETYELLKLLCVPEDGENITGLDLVITGMEVITTPKVLNFLLSLTKLANTDISD